MNYVKTLRFQDNTWKEDKAARQTFGLNGRATRPGQGRLRQPPQADMAGLPPGVLPTPNQPAPGTSARQEHQPLAR